MKKLATLLLAAGMVVAASAPASAADIKVDGFHMITFERHAYGFQNAAGDDNEHVGQRTRLGLNFTASENLSGYVQFQMGTNQWGDYNVRNAGDKHGRYNVQTRLAYIDWKIPATSIKVRMGRQQLGLPSDAFGANAVMSAGWGGRDGVALTAPVADWLSLNAFWVRAAVGAEDSYITLAADADGVIDEYSLAKSLQGDVDSADNADVFALAAPMKFDGLAVTPWIAYAAIDNGAATLLGVSHTEQIDLIKDNADLYWAGFTSTFSFFDPFTLKLSAAYGKADYEDDENDDRSGWYMQAKASYKLGFGTPVLGAWYGSGDDKGADKAGEGWIPMVNGQFLPTTTFHNGGYGLGNSMALENIAGTWGLQAGIEGVSFLKDLDHTFTVTYIGGTNNKDLTKTGKAGAGKTAYKYMTTEDSVVEFDFNTNYNIYKNLVANLEVAYLVSDFDNDAYKKAYDENDWRVALTFKYSF